MARKATAKGPAGGQGKAKPKGAKTSSRKRGKGSASSSSKGTSSSRKSAKSDTAADALIGLVESPLVADLLAAAVTAAAATILEHKLKRKQETGSLVRAVGAAAAAAVGRQLASEIEEIRKAAEEARSGKEE